MLDLHDPLWMKLNAGCQDADIAGLLARLFETWDDAVAGHLFWDCLCHQQTCYGSTYAAVPHLLNIARDTANADHRREIALFLGYVALCAFDFHPDVHCDPEMDDLNGLPSRRGRQSAVNSEDEGHAGIEALRTEFFELLPGIRAVCQRAFYENSADEDAARHMLIGVAAADGLFDLARFLEHGFDGSFRCSACKWQYEYIFFGDRVAFYVDVDEHDHSPVLTNKQADAAMKDYREGVASRSDGFISPIVDADRIEDARVTHLLAMAGQIPNPELVHFLQTMLGSFVCKKCGVEGPIRRL